jgi:hypothetical protein
MLDLHQDNSNRPNVIYGSNLDKYSVNVVQCCVQDINAVLVRVPFCK